MELASRDSEGWERGSKRPLGRPKEQPKLIWFQLLNGHLMISGPRLCSLSAHTEKHSFVWKKYHLDARECTLL